MSFTNAVDALENERDALLRQQEIISDISYTGGYSWHSVSEDVREALMDELNGSRGLHEKFVEWAKEFDALWEALPEDDDRRQNYIAEVDNFAQAKFDGLVATVRLEM